MAIAVLVSGLVMGPAAELAGALPGGALPAGVPVVAAAVPSPTLALREKHDEMLPLEWFHLIGTFPGSSGQVVHLQRWSKASSAWATVPNVAATTASDGTFTLRWHAEKTVKVRAVIGTRVTNSVTVYVHASDPVIWIRTGWFCEGGCTSFHYRRAVARERADLKAHYLVVRYQRLVILQIRRDGEWERVAVKHEGRHATTTFDPVMPKKPGRYSYRVVLAAFRGAPREKAKSVTFSTHKAWQSAQRGAAGTCAVSGDHTLWCWGRNENGQLDPVLARLGYVTVPIMVASPVEDMGWKAAETSDDHGCGVLTDGTLWCWGANSSGQLGNGTTDPSSSPVQVPSPVAGQAWKRLGLGPQRTCGVLTDGSAWCWGAAPLGDGTPDPSSSPVQVALPGGTQVSSVADGGTGVCLLTTDGQLFCWGDFPGDGTTWGGSLDDPVAVDAPVPDATWTSVVTTGSGACSTESTGDVYCWGEVGLDFTTDGVADHPTAPTLLVAPEGSWVDVSLSAAGGCGFTTTNQVWCWGDNTLGQYGVAAAESSVVPVPGASTPDGVTWGSFAGDSLGSGYCAFDVEGALWCWGYQIYGANGDGDGRVRPGHVY